MNRVGVAGRGESVWLGWFLHATLLRFAPHRRARGGDAAGGRVAQACLRPAAGHRARSLGRRLVPARLFRRRHAAWVRSSSDECRIDSIAQSWAVISGAAQPRARAARHVGGQRAAGQPQRWAGATVHPAVRSQRHTIRATSRPIRRACARTAGSTRTPRCGPTLAFAHARATAIARASCSRCSIPSIMRAPARPFIATRSNPMWSAPMCTRRPRTSAEAAGPGTRARRAGCIAPRSRASWESTCAVPLLRINPCIPRAWAGLRDHLPVRLVALPHRGGKSAGREPRHRSSDPGWTDAAGRDPATSDSRTTDYSTGAHHAGLKSARYPGGRVPIRAWTALRQSPGR